MAYVAENGAPSSPTRKEDKRESCITPKPAAPFVSYRMSGRKRCVKRSIFYVKSNHCRTAESVSLLTQTKSAIKFLMQF